MAGRAGLVTRRCAAPHVADGSFATDVLRTRADQCLLTAMVYPEAKMGRGSIDAKVANNLGLSSELVRQARTVLRCAPHLADDVLARKLSLVDAYQSVKARSINSGSRHQTVARDVTKSDPEKSDTAAARAACLRPWPA